MKTLFLVGVVGMVLGMACSSASLPEDHGTGGSGGSGGGAGGSGGAGGCQNLHYFSAGCDVAPTCFNGTGGSCFSLACGCSGKVIGGCANEFYEPYAYTVLRASFYDGGSSVGMTCDPTADAGH